MLAFVMYLLCALHKDVVIARRLAATESRFLSLLLGLDKILSRVDEFLLHQSNEVNRKYLLVTMAPFGDIC
jgi:hypothetical protein